MWEMLKRWLGWRPVKAKENELAKRSSAVLRLRRDVIKQLIDHERKTHPAEQQ
jgi:hypothetical protein